MKQSLGLFFLKYLRFLAKLQLAKIKPDIIGITGSAGKSSVRDAVHLILKSKYKCKVTGAANSESGIPLDILGLEMHSYSILEWLRVAVLAPIKLLTNWEKYDKYIVEMGIDSPDEPKNMSYLLSILQPRIGVFINAAAVHSELFDKLVMEKDPAKRLPLIIKRIAAEKGKMIESLPKDGGAVLNLDDKNVREFVKKTKAKVCGVCSDGCEDALHFESLSDLNCVSTKNIQYNLNGFSCDFEYRGTEEGERNLPSQHLEFRDQILGPQYGTTFALAIAVGLACGIAFDDCVDALRRYKLSPGRMSLLRGINDSWIIDSSYNASTEPMLAALDVLEKAGVGKKRIAVLGDMREMGAEAKLSHEIVAEKATQIADEMILVGPLMKEYFIPKAKSLGFDDDKIHWFENSAQAADFSKDLVQGGEVVLVKGSQNTIFLERVVEELMLEKDRADKLLCRRGEYWERERSNYV